MNAILTGKKVSNFLISVCLLRKCVVKNGLVYVIESVIRKDLGRSQRWPIKVQMFLRVKKI